MDPAQNPPRVRISVMLGLGVLMALSAMIGLNARATYGAQTSADEPQYLLTAISLVDDFDLDISNQLDERAYEPFHEVTLNEQTAPLDDAGRRVSPHDPLLPILLSPSVAVGGWMGAKVMLALMGGAAAALTWWIAVARFGCQQAIAAVVVGAFFVGMPLTSYSTQIYPEMAAAVAGLVAVAALLAPVPGRRHLAAVALAVVALPWLSVKYVPTAMVLGGLLVYRLWRTGRRRELLALCGWGVAMGALYLAIHQWVYGGWTVYAAGDHFVERGEFAVVGGRPDYVGRSRRVIGLLVDRRYGLIGWAPAWLLAVPAVAWFAACRQRTVEQRAVVLLPLAAGWSTASFVALSMHSWWSPGRQIVVVAPLVVIAVAVLVDRVRRLVWPVVILGLLGAVNWWWLALEAQTGRRTIIVDFFETDSLPYRWLSPLLAQGWSRTAEADLIRTVWLAMFLIVALVVVRLARPGPIGVRRYGLLVAASAVLGVAGWIGNDDGELTRPAEIYRPDRASSDDG